jgi:hypothetical protein
MNTENRSIVPYRSNMNVLNREGKGPGGRRNGRAKLPLSLSELQLGDRRKHQGDVARASQLVQRHELKRINVECAGLM